MDELTRVKYCRAAIVACSKLNPHELQKCTAVIQSTSGAYVTIKVWIPNSDLPKADDGDN